eukprot:CAMPEP_0171702766 /NCGR_PEP_ID=MMETSP0991-20121206/11775_1 /TAXON_ID=483369 /ORGANISM="non described non described, Strain CCMP2098" /LENGTH=499 /DNA_ID=CAMNT_0012292139 /DNA_START=23 /DNA_END=1522 /DNA_ORIENTATION=+
MRRWTASSSTVTEFEVRESWRNKVSYTLVRDINDESQETREGLLFAAKLLADLTFFHQGKTTHEYVEGETEERKWELLEPYWDHIRKYRWRSDPRDKALVDLEKFKLPRWVARSYRFSVIETLSAFLTPVYGKLVEGELFEDGFGLPAEPCAGAELFPPRALASTSAEAASSIQRHHLSLRDNFGLEEIVKASKVVGEIFGEKIRTKTEARGAEILGEIYGWTDGKKSTPDVAMVWVDAEYPAWGWVYGPTTERLSDLEHFDKDCGLRLRPIYSFKGFVGCGGGGGDDTEQVAEKEPRRVGGGAMEKGVWSQAEIQADLYGSTQYDIIGAEVCRNAPRPNEFALVRVHHSKTHEAGFARGKSKSYGDKKSPKPVTEAEFKEGLSLLAGGENCFILCWGIPEFKIIRAKKVFNLREKLPDGTRNGVVDVLALLRKIIKPSRCVGSHSLNIHTMFTRLRAHTHGAEDDSVAAAALFYLTMDRLIDEAAAVSVKRNDAKKLK